MIEIFLAVIAFGVLIAMMAVGVLMGRKPISGSCGGVGAALGEDDYTCELCGGDPAKCDEVTAEQQSGVLYNEASPEQTRD